MTGRRLVEASCAAASGILLAAALPPYSRSPLAWVALVPLLVLRRDRTPLRLAVLAAGAILPPLWTVGTMLGLLGIPTTSRAAIVIGVPALVAAGTLAGIVAERRLRSPLVRALVAPLLLAAIEGALRATFDAYPVPSLAWSQPPNGLLIHVGLAVGTPLPVTFLIALTNVGIADAILASREALRAPRSPWRVPVATALAVLSFTANLAFGYVRASAVEDAPIALEKGPYR